MGTKIVMETLMYYWSSLPHREIYDALTLISIILASIYVVFTFTHNPALPKIDDGNPDRIIQSFKKYLDDTAEGSFQKDSKILCGTLVVSHLLELPFAIYCDLPILFPVLGTLAWSFLFFTKIGLDYQLTKARSEMREHIEKLGKVENHTFKSEWPPKT